ncbi:hypothetical protein F2P81_004957 [Scophthalmus maximus]|uniref:Uncharacterized protein n=1 Tax=Scophthalmus maximus TaxID=52904 RepID=A0A6A4TIS9_SCOMX|nr:hypothetical protein F2P81_004957 [Scophthalmus maximus]
MEIDDRPNEVPVFDRGNDQTNKSPAVTVHLRVVLGRPGFRVFQVVSDLRNGLRYTALALFTTAGDSDKSSNSYVSSNGDRGYATNTSFASDHRGP